MPDQVMHRGLGDVHLLFVMILWEHLHKTTKSRRVQFLLGKIYLLVICSQALVARTTPLGLNKELEFLLVVGKTTKSSRVQFLLGKIYLLVTC
jgi:hypothetical protein